MAKKKIYAVRKGHKTGLFATWAECQKAVSGYSGAEFRGFTEKEEALAFLNMETTGNVSGDKAKEAAGIVEVPENMVIAYVDGSFEKSIGRYGDQIIEEDDLCIPHRMDRKSVNPAAAVILQESRSEMWQERCLVP